MRWLRRNRLAGVVVVALLVGCAGPKLPKTYPARGSVVHKGGQPLKGGSIQFKSQTDPDLRVVGSIKEDGTFTLQTLKDKAKTDGAPEGDYQVLIIPPLEGDHKGQPPITLPGTRKVEPTDNDFKFDLDGPGP